VLVVSFRFWNSLVLTIDFAWKLLAGYVTHFPFLHIILSVCQSVSLMFMFLMFYVSKNSIRSLAFNVTWMARSVCFNNFIRNTYTYSVPVDVPGHSTNRLPVLFTGSKEAMSTMQHDYVPIGSPEDLYVTPRRNGLTDQSKVTEGLSTTPLLDTGCCALDVAISTSLS